MKKRNKETCQ